jgi:Ca2+-binding RTX toxin-like protein
VLLGAALGGAPAGAAVNLTRTDVPLPGAPDSVALGDLDGRNGLDIAIAFPILGRVGVMLNNGDGSFAAVQLYDTGPGCGSGLSGTAVDITLGDVTQPAPGNRLIPDGKLDAYVACTPNVLRLTGDGTGALGNPEPINVGVAQYLGSGTLDLLALVHRADGNPVPLLLFQGDAGLGGPRRLCLSFNLVPGGSDCGSTSVQGPLAVADLNGSGPGVPPDEIITSEGGTTMGFLGFTNVLPLMWGDSPRTVPSDPSDPSSSPGGLESAALGDLDNDGDLDILAGKPVNSAAARVQAMHYFIWGATGLEQVARPLPSTPGLDAVAIADVDGDGCNDVVAAGDYGRGMIHLGTGGGNFDGGQDLPQVGYGNPATATRVTLAVGDLTGDGRPDLVIADNLSHYVMVYRNASTPSATGCGHALPTTADSDPPPVLGTPTPPPPPPPPPPAPRTCDQPGTVPYTVGTNGDDVLVGSAARDTLSGRGGQDCVFGRSGDDRLNGGSGNDVLSGSGGNDRMNGDAGADRLNGGNGNDSITPGAGKDKVAANGGDDTISARDGTKDTIDCGAGHDKVTADRNDALNNCEFVTRRGPRPRPG